jgi:hypothetical protein
MAHFAKLDNYIVVDVNCVSNDTINNLPFPESEPIGIEFLIEWSGGYADWKQTSYNGNFRKRYAGIGYTYNAALDAFIAPQPFPSWTLNTTTADWEAPVPYPTDGQQYVWNESTQAWDLIELP